MCGLAGMVQTHDHDVPKPDSIEAFIQLSVLSQLRGYDSAGLAGLWRSDAKASKAFRHGWMVHKALSSPYEVFKQFQNGLLDWHANKRTKKDRNKFHAPHLVACIAHARAATVGSVSAENAHPFSFGNQRFIGVHNGTLTAPEKIYLALKDQPPLPDTVEPTKDYAQGAKVATDSEIALYCLYRWGIEKVYPLLEGAWAIVWFSETDGTVNFIRNYQRDLYWTFSHIDHTIHWVSEKAMFEFLAQRERFKLLPEWRRNGYKIFDAHKQYVVELKKPYSLKAEQSPFSAIIDRADLRPKTTYVGYTYAGGGEQSVVPFVPKPKKTGSMVVGGDTSVSHTSKRYSGLQQKFIPLTEWIAEQKALVGNMYQPPETDDNETEHCFWCGSELTAANLEGSLPVRAHGTVCGDCANNAKDVEDITSSYVETCYDNAWINRFMNLTDKEKQSA